MPLQLAIFLAFAAGMACAVWYVALVLLVRDRRDRKRTRPAAPQDITNAPPDWRKRLKRWQRLQRT